MSSCYLHWTPAKRRSLNNGNLLYDGVQAYTYDAWNRMKTVAHAYRDSSNNLQSGQVFDTIGYDATGRRITKAVNGTGAMDCTYNYFLDGQSVIEEQNGSGQSIEDHVWGLQYVDEAVQTRVNTNPTGTASWTSYWLCQDANYNVLGIVSSTGTLTERYEYSAYGQRQVFASAGSNDPGCYAPTYASTRVVTSGGVIQPYGICSFGYQGLLQDEESALAYSRWNFVDPSLGRFQGPDDLWPCSGLNCYGYLAQNPIAHVDPYGLVSGTIEAYGGEAMDAYNFYTYHHPLDRFDLPTLGFSNTWNWSWNASWGVRLHVDIPVEDGDFLGIGVPESGVIIGNELHHDTAGPFVQWKAANLPAINGNLVSVRDSSHCKQCDTFMVRYNIERAPDALLTFYDWLLQQAPIGKVPVVGPIYGKIKGLPPLSLKGLFGPSHKNDVILAVRVCADGERFAGAYNLDSSQRLFPIGVPPNGDTPGHNETVLVGSWAHSDIPSGGTNTGLLQQPFWETYDP